MRKVEKICVYCASSKLLDQKYFDAADRLAKIMVDAGATLVYGGGAYGLMGRMADEVLRHGGHVIGIMPEFMKSLEVDHKKVDEMVFVADMHARKKRFLDEADAVVALPGGCGTFEELFEAITWKRLGLITEPIIIVNTDGYYDPLLAMLERSVEERFMGEAHRAMWSVVREPEEVMDAIQAAPVWDEANKGFAQIG